MKLVNALVDYDNVRPLPGPERGPHDVEANLASLIPRLANRVSTAIPDSQEVSFRLYGGWILLDRQYSQQAGWLLGEVGKLRGRHGPLRARLTIATALVARTDLILVGTYRDGGQKMVDEMISVDLVHLAEDNASSLVLVSDDDDFVPALLASSTRRTRLDPIITFRRKKKIGSAPNDTILRASSIVIAEY